MKEGSKERILILGGSGFIGQALYRELQSFFDVQATYYSQIGNFSENNAYHHFSLETDSAEELLNRIKPTVIVSALRAPFLLLQKCYQEINTYVLQNRECRVLIFSSAAVFDAKPFFPAYDDDSPLAASLEGKREIALEKIFSDEIPNRTTICRLPLVLGINSPHIFHLRQCIKHYAAFEVFPNLIVTATTINKIKLQIHYLINRALTGVFHLTSDDMIHHDELFTEITRNLGDKIPIFKNVYSSNEDRYKSLLPRVNLLPDTYRITMNQVIEESSLTEASTPVT